MSRRAESWRWYFEPEWESGAGLSDMANYPVAFWDPAWEDIVLHGHDGRSHVNETLSAGFDGIYMDWVEAFSDDTVIVALADARSLTTEQASELSASLMLDFIAKIRQYARSQAPQANPEYLVVAPDGPSRS